MVLLESKCHRQPTACVLGAGSLLVICHSLFQIPTDSGVQRVVRTTKQVEVIAAIHILVTVKSAAPAACSPTLPDSTGCTLPTGSTNGDSITRSRCHSAAK